MRIVAGKWRGRLIASNNDEHLRPTADRVREAWLEIVNPLLPDSRVVDLFAGSGALGFEALSRGATRVDFVESAPRSVETIKGNAEVLGAGRAAVVHKADAFKFIEKLEPSAYDVAFADPPYDRGFATLIAKAWLKTPFADVLGVEHRADEILPSGGEARKYGGSVVTLYRNF